MPLAFKITPEQQDDVNIQGKKQRNLSKARRNVGMHKLGWRLLMSPWSTLSSARSAIITMNPGTPRDSAKRPSVIEWEVPILLG